MPRNTVIIRNGSPRGPELSFRRLWVLRRCHRQGAMLSRRQLGRSAWDPSWERGCSENLKAEFCGVYLCYDHSPARLGSITRCHVARRHAGHGRLQAVLRQEDYRERRPPKLMQYKLDESLTTAHTLGTMLIEQPAAGLAKRRTGSAGEGEAVGLFVGQKEAISI